MVEFMNPFQTESAKPLTFKVVHIPTVCHEICPVSKFLRMINRPFPSCCEPHYESEAKCKVFIMKISFHSYANKTEFQMKSFALSLAFIMRFAATRKWPIEGFLN